jgi:hypothetical protein
MAQSACFCHPQRALDAAGTSLSPGADSVVGIWQRWLLAKLRVCL